MDVSIEAKRRAYAAWLRTGRWPVARGADGTEWKFNPWHDPRDGRFTTAGSGSVEATTPPAKVQRRGMIPTGRQLPEVGSEKPNMADKAATLLLAPIKSQVNFDIGVIKGVAGSFSGVVRSAKSLAAHPVTTIVNSNLSLASSIDRFVADEDKPTVERLKNIATKISKKSPEEFGYFLSKNATDFAMYRGAKVLGQISKLAKMRVSLPVRSPTPKLVWVKENVGGKSIHKLYNDAAPGARPGHAPALMRTLADGTKRPVKFDGIDGKHLIDRKWNLTSRPNSKKQILRQDAVLREHGVHAIYELSTDQKVLTANKILNKLKTTNISTRKAEP